MLSPLLETPGVPAWFAPSFWLALIFWLEKLLLPPPDPMIARRGVFRPPSEIWGEFSRLRNAAERDFSRSEMMKQAILAFVASGPKTVSPTANRRRVLKGWNPRNRPKLDAEKPARATSLARQKLAKIMPLKVVSSAVAGCLALMPKLGHSKCCSNLTLTATRNSMKPN
jgi:hypothetical protein